MRTFLSAKEAINLETKAKLNKVQYPFSNEVSLNVSADFQLIPSKDVRKRTKNVQSCMQPLPVNNKKPGPGCSECG